MKFLATPEIPVLAQAPASPDEGEMYYDSALDTLRVYAEGAWRSHVSDGQPLFVSAADPVTDAERYLWVQTGINGTDMTFWVEDGTV